MTVPPRAQDEQGRGATTCACRCPACPYRFAHLAKLPAGAERREARNALVEQHLPLARSVAARFRRPTVVSDEDLRQVAAVGLVEAVDRFDPGHQASFSAFARPTISGCIKKYFRDNLWPMHVPRSVKTRTVELAGVARELEQQLGGPPSRAELAGATGVGPDDLVEVLRAGAALTPSSLDSATGDGEGTPLREQLGEPDAGYERVEAAMTVRALLPRLRPPERQAIVLRFFTDMPQSQIAERFGVSQAQVSRLQRRGLETMRRMAAA